MIVELLDRRGGVRQRLRLAAFPATVGRAPRNDIVLDDRYADPVHARIEWDPGGGLVLSDLGSVNGLREGHGGRPVQRVALRHGTEVRLGRTVLRFVDPDRPVEPALPESPAAGRFGLGESRARALAVLALTVVVLTLNTWLEKTGRVRFTALLGEALMAVLVVAVWAGGWALVSRVTQHRFRFLEHLAIPSLALTAITLTTALSEYLQFLYPVGADWSLWEAVAGFGIVVAAVAAQLHRVSALGRAPRLLWSVGVVGALVGIVALADESEEPPFVGGLEESPLKPVTARWIPTTNPAGFFGRVDDLKGEVDALGRDEEEEAGEDTVHLIEE